MLGVFMKGSAVWMAIRQVGLALLNATLMLLLAVLVAAFLLVGRVQDLAQNTRIAIDDVLAPQALRLERIATAVEGIELRVSEGTLEQPLREEVVGLRSDIAEVQSGLHAIAQIGPQELTAQMIRILGGWLSAYSSDR